MSQVGARQCIFTTVFKWKGPFLTKNSYIVKKLLWQLKPVMKNKPSENEVQVFIFRNQTIESRKSFLTEKTNWKLIEFKWQHFRLNKNYTVSSTISHWAFFGRLYSHQRWHQLLPLSRLSREVPPSASLWLLLDMHEIHFLKCCIIIWAFPTMWDKNFTPSTDYDAVWRYFEIFNS